MKLDNNMIRELCSFYNNLPVHILNDILDDTNIQRYAKGESIEEKLNSLLTNSQPHNGSRRSHNSCWRYFVCLVSEKVNKEDVIDENIKSMCKKIADVTEESPTNTEAIIKLNLKKLISTDEFVTVLNTMDYNHNDDSIIVKETNTKEETRMRMNMNKYIGFIRLDNYYYYNFYPKYILSSDKKVIPIEDSCALFPEKGNIYLDDGYYKDQIKQFCEKNTFCVIEFSDDDLLDYSKKDGELNQTNKKLLVPDLFQESKITTLQDNNLFLIFERTDDSLNNPFVIDPNRLLSDNTQVLISYSKKYIGPYVIGYDKSVDKHFAKINRADDRYVLKTYDIDPILIDYDEYSTYNVYFANLNNVIPQIEDNITDDELIASFAAYQKSTGNSVIEEFCDALAAAKESPFSEGVAKNIVEDRFSRLMNMADNQQKINQHREELALLLQNELAYNNTEDQYKDLIKIIADNNTTLSEIKSKITDASNEYENTKIEHNALEAECEKLRNNLQEYRDFDQQKLAEKKEELNSKIKELDEINNELKFKQNELEELTKELKIVKNYKALKKDNEDLLAENKALAIVTSSAKKSLEDIIKTQEESAHKVVYREFEKSITSKLIKSAAEWEKQQDDNKIKEIANKLISVDSQISVNPYSQTQLVSFLCEEVRKYRDYSNNQIINMFICIANGFLTVFSGNPGTGKTSICNIIAQVMGLQSIVLQEVDEKYTNRFIPISVERNWTTKRDLIGYYNPLTKNFDNSNSIYDGLNILSNEGDNSLYPYLILLDEANLSPLEYYWSDFMALADNDGFREMYVELGNNIKLYIPDTLRFVATINNDHTTEPLSPRVIDRSWIINLPEVNWEKVKCFIPSAFDNNNSIVMWKNFVETFKNVNMETNFKNSDIVKKITDLFKENDTPISSRSLQQINDYICVAQKLFEDEANTIDTSYIAIDYAVLQKILPQINGCSLDFLDKLLKACDNLPMSKAKINKIIKKGSDMEYYTFF